MRGFDADKRGHSCPAPVWEYQQTANRGQECPRSQRYTNKPCSFGWDRFAVRDTAMVTPDTFGASGHYTDLAKLFRFTVENVLAKTKQMPAFQHPSYINN